MTAAYLVTDDGVYRTGDVMTDGSSLDGLEWIAEVRKPVPNRQYPITPDGRRFLQIQGTVVSVFLDRIHTLPPASTSRITFIQLRKSCPDIARQHTADNASEVFANQRTGSPDRR